MPIQKVNKLLSTLLAAKQDSLGYTAENASNKSTSTTLGTSTTLYPCENVVKVNIDAKQNMLLTRLAKSNMTSSGSIGTAATTVDIYDEIEFSQTSSNIAASLPAPTVSRKRVKVVVSGSSSTASLSFDIGAGRSLSLDPGYGCWLEHNGSYWQPESPQQTTNASNITIQGTFTPSNSAIVTGDTVKVALQKAQGEIENKQNLVSSATQDNIATLNSGGQTIDSGKKVNDSGTTTSDIWTASKTKSYADGLVVGLWDDRGNYDASSNVFPSSGGSGGAGAILKGDIWTISVAGTLGGVPIAARQTIRATIDTPDQTLANWAIGLANTDIDDSITDGITGRAPSQNAVYDALSSKVNTSTTVNSQALSGNVTLTTDNIQESGSPTNKWWTNVRTIAATLTSYIKGAGTISSSDTILQAIQKLDGNDDLKAPLASPSLVGTPTAPTANVGDSSTQISTTEFTTTAINNALSGLINKTACIYATTSTLPSATYNNGSSGVGATLTAIVSGALSIDGNIPSVGNRVLIKNQSSALQNGIYSVTVVGSGSVAFVLTRTTDFDTSIEVQGGDNLFIANGSTLASTTWQMNTAGTIVIGTTSINWTQIAGVGTYTAGTGLTLSGNSFSITNTTVSSGSYGSSSSIPNFNVNAQGQITLAGSNSVTAPAGAVTGTTLASNVVNSSLNTLGTITTGVWNASTLGILYGGTGSTTQQGALNALTGTQSNGKYLRSDGTNSSLSTLLGGDVSGSVGLATAISGGSANAIPFQTGANATTFLAQGTGVLEERAGTPNWTTVPTLTGTNFSSIPPSAISNAYRNIYYVHGTLGSDSNNGLTPDTAFATLGQALTTLGNGSGFIGILKGTSENLTITSTNIMIASMLSNNLGQVAMTGVITVATNTSPVGIYGIAFATLNHTGSGSLYLQNCSIQTTFSDSGSGFLKTINTDMTSATVSITGTGYKNFFDSSTVGALTVNNASSLVTVKNSTVQSGITLTAGIFNLMQSSGFITSSSSYFATVAANSNFVVSDSIIQNNDGTPAKIQVVSGGFYVFNNFKFNNGASVISGTDLNAFTSRFGTIYSSIANITSLTLVNALGISSGGTNSGTTLTNGKVMISNAGAIVESSITTAQLATIGTGTTLAKLAPLVFSSGNSGKIVGVASDGSAALVDPVGGGTVVPSLGTGNLNKIAIFNTDNGNQISYATNTASQRQITTAGLNIIATYTSAERDTLTWTTGAAIWNSTLNLTQYYNGTAWISSKITSISTTAQTLALTDNIVIITPNSQATSFAITLADPNIISGIKVRVMLPRSLTTPNYGCTLNAPLAKTVGGLSSFVLTGAGDFVDLVSNGTDWLIFDKKPLALLLYSNMNWSAPIANTPIIWGNLMSEKYSQYEIRFKAVNAGGVGTFCNNFNFVNNTTLDTTANYSTGGSYVGASFQAYIGSPFSTTAIGGATNIFNFTGSGDSVEMTMIINNPMAASNKTYFITGSYTVNGVRYTSPALTGIYVGSSLHNGLAYTNKSGTASGSIEIWAIK